MQIFSECLHINIAKQSSGITVCVPIKGFLYAHIAQINSIFDLNSLDGFSSYSCLYPVHRPGQSVSSANNQIMWSALKISSDIFSNIYSLSRIILIILWNRILLRTLVFYTV